MNDAVSDTTEVEWNYIAGFIGNYTSCSDLQSVIMREW